MDIDGCAAAETLRVATPANETQLDTCSGPRVGEAVNEALPGTATPADLPPIVLDSDSDHPTQPPAVGVVEDTPQHDCADAGVVILPGSSYQSHSRSVRTVAPEPAPPASGASVARPWMPVAPAWTSGLEALDDIDIMKQAMCAAPMCRHIPRRHAHAFTELLGQAFDWGASVIGTRPPVHAETCPAEFIPLLLPRLILWQTEEVLRLGEKASQGGHGSAAARRAEHAEMTRVVGRRLAVALRGDFAALFRDLDVAAQRFAARTRVSRRGGGPDGSEEGDMSARIHDVVKLVKAGEISRAAQRLQSSGIASGTDEVENKLRDMLGCRTESPLPSNTIVHEGLSDANSIDYKTFADALREAARGGGQISWAFVTSICSCSSETLTRWVACSGIAIA